MDRVEALNERIAARRDAAMPEMVFSPRPTPTKHVLFPIVDIVQPSKAVIQSKPLNFLPGTTAPGIRHIDLESELRNQIYALQRDDRAVYRPSPKSDLYVSRVPKLPNEQPHPLLFVHAKATATPKLKEKLFNNVRLR